MTDVLYGREKVQRMQKLNHNSIVIYYYYYYCKSCVHLAQTLSVNKRKIVHFFELQPNHGYKPLDLVTICDFNQHFSFCGQCEVCGMF